MKHCVILSILFSLLVPAVLSAQMPPHLWSDIYGDSQVDVAKSIAIYDDGSHVVASYFEGTIDFGGGPLTSVGGKDIYMAKFDVFGNHVWSKRFGDPGDQRADGLALDSNGNIYMAATVGGYVNFGGGTWSSYGQEDVFLAKFDPNGNHIWTRRAGSGYREWAGGVAVDNNDDAILMGTFDYRIDFGQGVIQSAGGNDGFVAKYDTDGNFLWHWQCGSGAGNDLREIDIDQDNNIFLTGGFWSGNMDAMFFKVDSSGNQLYNRHFGYNDGMACDPRCITVDASGNVILGGYFDGHVDFGGGTHYSAGSNDIYLAKFDNDGTYIWSRSFGDAANQVIYGLDSDDFDNIYLCGFTNGSIDLGGGLLSSAGGNDMLLASFDPSGDHRWSDLFGDSGDQWFYKVYCYNSSLFVSGNNSSTVDFGGGPLASAGDYDAVLVLFGDMTVATTLHSFSAAPGTGAIEIDWRLSGLGTGMEFSVSRSENGGVFGPVLASVERIDDHSFRLVDGSCEQGKTYRYRVNVRDEDGSRLLFETEQLSLPAVAFALFQNVPNPFNPATTISFYLPEASHVRVEIYDTAGRRITTLVDGIESDGMHEINWDGRDDSGTSVASGVYFYKLFTGKFTDTKKMVLLR